MKDFAIIFLLLVVPAAIQCTAPFLVSERGLGDATNPLGSLLESYLDKLTGSNGLFSGLGLKSHISQLLDGLLGPKGSLTGIVSGGGKRAAGLQTLIAEVLNLAIGSNGLLSKLLEQGGMLHGLLEGKGGGTNTISDLLVSLLGPNGLVASLLGPNGLLEGLLSGKGGDLNLFKLLNSLLGPNGLVTVILNALIGKNGLLGGGGNENGLLSGLLGPNGLVGKLLSTVVGLLGGLLGGGKGGGPLGGNLGPHGLLDGLLGLVGGLLGKLLGGKTSGGTLDLLKNLLTKDLSGGGQTGGDIDWTSVIDNAMCQLQAQFPGQNLTSVENTCLTGVPLSDLAAGIQDSILHPSCNAAPTEIPTGEMFPDLDSFVSCVQNAMSNRK